MLQKLFASRRPARRTDTFKEAWLTRPVKWSSSTALAATWSKANRLPFAKKMGNGPFRLRNVSLITIQLWPASYEFTNTIHYSCRFAGLSVPRHDDRRYHFYGEILLSDRRDGDVRLFGRAGSSRQSEPSLSKGRQMVIGRPDLRYTPKQLSSNLFHILILLHFTLVNPNLNVQKIASHFFLRSTHIYITHQSKRDVLNQVSLFAFRCYIITMA